MICDGCGKDSNYDADYSAWSDKGCCFTESSLCLGEYSIVVTGIHLVEIEYNGNYFTVPNCKTIKDIKQLIKLFKP